MDLIVKMDKSETAQKLTPVKGEYATIVEALKNANATMLGLNSYWEGILYNQIVTTWNTLCPVLNDYLRNAARAFNFMSGALKIYTDAETDKVDLGLVDEVKLQLMEPKDGNQLRATTQKIREDQGNICSKITTAKSNISKMFNHIISTPASSQAIDAGKSYMKQNNSKIMDGLQEIYNVVYNNMDVAASRLEKAETGIKKALQ